MGRLNWTSARDKRNSLLMHDGLLIGSGTLQHEPSIMAETTAGRKGDLDGEEDIHNRISDGKGLFGGQGQSQLRKRDYLMMWMRERRFWTIVLTDVMCGGLQVLMLSFSPPEHNDWVVVSLSSLALVVWAAYVLLRVFPVDPWVFHTHMHVLSFLHLTLVYQGEDFPVQERNCAPRALADNLGKIVFLPFAISFSWYASGDVTLVDRHALLKDKRWRLDVMASYVLPWIVGLHVNYVGKLNIGVDFVLSPHDSKTWSPQVISLVVFVFSLIMLVIGRGVYLAFKKGVLGLYLVYYTAVFVAFGICAKIVTDANEDFYKLHVHHWFLSGLALPFTRFRGQTSRIGGAFFSAFLLQGLSTYGPCDVFEPPPSNIC